MKFPETAKEVLGWTTSANYWVRRGAAVSLVLPARKGGQIELVLNVADLLLNDQEDLVRKAYGWLLKVASSKFSEKVFGFVMERREIMPRVALRYAIENMPKQVQQQALGTN